MRFAAFAALLLGCGRLNFNEQVAGDASSELGDATIDGLNGAAVCGNAVCEGTLGEICGMCPADCATANAVCGNSQCDTNEDGSNCYADCGPAVWPWTQDEMDLLAAVNVVRTGGVTCPNETTQRMAAALTLTTSVVPGAREYAWEMAHHGTAAGATSCNGRTFAQRQTLYGANGGLSVSASGPLANMTQVVNVWKSSDTLCVVLMTTGPTMAGTAVAHDTAHGYVIWFK